MIAEKRLPPMIAIFIASGGGDGKGSERGLEYDTVSGDYADFIETEVLPRIEKDYNVKFTKDPEGRATMGGSSGGACAFTMAWFRPELYHRVLSYSGTFVDQQSPMNPKSPHGAWEYHENLIPKSDAKPIRVWLEVGEKDNGYNRDEASLHNWVHGQRPHGRRPEGQEVPLPLRLRGRRRARGRQGREADASRGAALAVAGIPDQVRGAAARSR